MNVKCYKLKNTTAHETFQGYIMQLPHARGHDSHVVYRTRTQKRYNATAHETFQSYIMHGHLDVVRYLHEHHHMTARTTAAMDDAATAGFDDIVMFLALHRQERGTEQTMAVYAEHGILERMRWLHAHGVQTYAPRVLNAAASSGHLHVVQYLLDEAHVVGVYLPALNGSAKEGHFDIVKHFLARWADQDVCVAAAMRAAHVAGHDLILDYLDVHRCQCCQEKSRDVVLAKKTAKRRRCDKAIETNQIEV
ncbi:Aste57867_14897 [Aphanomyces stellatus]|uniref:Aste57867_14897 protein n=1 Tax=Aphanomyces stellatus TaxID=120398 RepID=A0A485L2E7_9STRA|nr:hypothetical protein As57867_014841 [Aphanomyces stellatus]VFT91713.1 Aste57867_14897 [Aphanomyces stellatus]